MANENIEVGTRAVAKVGRHEINVEVIAVENGSYLVRNDAGREFYVAHLTVPDEAALCEDDASNPAPESERRPKKKLSLFEAVITALKSEPAGTALNTRELVALAVEKGLWQPSGAKTPEQTLYSAIFRENATKEHPRIVKSDKKGKFICAGE